MIVNAAALSALFTGLRSEFRVGFEDAPSHWEMLATLIPSTSKSNTYTWLGNFPTLRKWIGDKAIQNLEAHKYTLDNEDFEATVEVDRNDIEDDNLGVYSPLARTAGYSAKTWADERVLPLLSMGFSSKCFDKQPFFSANHKVGKKIVSNHGGGTGTPWFLLDVSKPLKPLIFQQRKKPVFVALDDDKSENAFMRRKYLYGVEARGAFGYGFWQTAYGSKQGLGADSYAASRAAMGSFKDDQGRPLNIQPGLLVVPPTLEAAARTLLKNERAADGSTNPWFGTAELLVTPWLA